MDNIYVRLTKQFNEGAQRAILSSGQAVVFYQLAVMSKDGDWIVSEKLEDLEHILSVLQSYGAQYRFGAPLDVRWLQNGWSSHFEFSHSALRVRADFVSRPPRMTEAALKKLWDKCSSDELPVIDKTNLAEIKKTDREKDYPVIGELARIMPDVYDQLLYSRSARDIIRIQQGNQEVFQKAAAIRPVLAFVEEGQDKLEEELDRERRGLIKANAERLKMYSSAASRWYRRWPALQNQIKSLSLREAHSLITSEAVGTLPFDVGSLGA